MKKCITCNKKMSLDCFAVNKTSSDGYTSSCKKCLNKRNKERRMSLNYMIKKVDPKFHNHFSLLHQLWKKSGYNKNLKPVIINNQCMTFKTGSTIKKNRFTTLVYLLDENKKNIKTFKSISHATSQTGDSRSYIKWSSLNGLPTKNGNIFKIN
tara:strand:+ start:560 stop:1018 length:459 start_codon:yes stop_codon:yes gene_type:complete